MAEGALEDRRIWLDGRLVPFGEVTVHVLSQSVQRGSLVFDVMPCYWTAEGPSILGLREHVDRFLNSAVLSSMDLAFDREGILAGIAQTVRANPGAQIVKISAYYPGVSLDVLPVDPQASIAIAAVAIRDVLAPGIKAPKPGPATLQIPDPRKLPPWVLSPQAKLAAGYLYTSVAKRAAREAGYHDVLLLDERGDVAESSTQSFFLIEDGTLYTAPLDYVLAGITRRAVMELAVDEELPIKEGPVPAQRLSTCQEAFLAGTTVNIWPVSRIDERDLPQPVPGPITDRLMQRFARMIEGQDERFSPRWMQRI